jgi:hypothetical protein
VLGNRLLAVLSRPGIRVSLFFLGCGALAHRSGSLKALREFSMRYVIDSHLEVAADNIFRYQFEHTFAFTARRFLATEASTLISDFVQRVYIHGSPTIFTLTIVLPNCLKLGEHSGLVLISPDGTITSFTWAHKTRRPFGGLPRFQCSRCKCFRSYHRVKREVMPGVVTWMCKGTLAGESCRAVQAFAQRAGVRILNVEGRGCWELRSLPAGESVAGFMS